MLPRRAQPEMPIAEQKINAMLFRRNGVVAGDLHWMNIGGQ
jgi:hypothetical protein